MAEAAARADTPRSPRDGPTRVARRGAWLAVAALVLTFGGHPASAPPPERGAEADPSIDLSDAVTLTLTPPEDAPDGGVRIAAHVGDAPLLEAEGRLPFALAVPRGQDVAVLVEAPGRARFFQRVRVDDDGPLAVALPPGERLRGVVVDERGEAVARARVTVRREDADQPPWETRTDDAGTFLLDTLSAGSHRVEAVAAGHAGVVAARVEPQSDLRLTLDRAGIVAGRVIGPDGRNVGGATVEIAGSGLWPARAARTAADGRFVLRGVPPGIYEVRARHEARVAEPRRGIEIEPATERFLTFRLRAGARLAGRVTDADTGEPVEGASVTASAAALDVSPRAAVSGPDGRFVISGLRRVSHRVSVRAPGYVPATALEWSVGEPLEVALVPGGALVGVVLDEDRRPVEGAHLEILGDSEGQPVALDEHRGFAAAVFDRQLAPPPLAAGPMSLPVTSGPVPPLPLDGPVTELSALAPLPASPRERALGAGHVTDAEGRFHIDGVPPGRLQLVARRDGLAPRATDRFYLAAGQTRDDLELVLPAAGELTGRVLDARGDGLEGVLVEVRGDRAPHPRVAVSDQEGAFSLDGVVGELTVTAMPSGHPAARARASVAPGGAAEVLLQLEDELHTLYGRTVDARGFPVGNVQVSLRSLRSRAPHQRTVWSEADGTFAIAGLPSPPWRLEASEAGHAPSRRDVFREDDEVPLTLERGAEVRGAVRDDYTGEPVAAQVTLRRQALPAETLRTRTGEDGGFRFGRVRAAPWTLHVEAEGYLPHAQSMTVQDRGRGPADRALDPVRLTPGGRVEGTVVDALGRPVARARVWWDQRETRADGRGEYVLEGLPAGELTLRAAHPAAGETEADPVRVLEGRETLGVVLHLPERFDPARAETLEGRRRGVAIGLRRRGEAIEIARVEPGSRAEEVGLREGDALVAVDDEPVDATELARAARALRGPPSVPAILRVRRGDLEVDLVVGREVWLP